MSRSIGVGARRGLISLPRWLGSEAGPRYDFVMSRDFLPWLGLAVQLVGLALIALDLFLPRARERLQELAETAVPRPIGGSERQRATYRLTVWIGLYTVAWIAVAGGLSMVDADLGVVANLVFAVLTALVLLLLGLYRMARRAGLVLGRATSLGSLGLSTAMIGLSIQCSALLAWG